MKVLMISCLFSAGLAFHNKPLVRQTIRTFARGLSSKSPVVRGNVHVPKMSVVEEATETISDDELFGFDLPTNENNPNLLRVRHTTAHVMAMAVQKLFPEAQVTIGPWIDGGLVFQ
jgi:hypothetical protein